MRQIVRTYSKNFGAFLASLGIAVVAALTNAPQADAINVFKNPDAAQTDAAGVVTNQGGQTFETIVGNIVSTLFIVIGIISVIMIIIGGIRYATSNGDQAAIKSAKNTILYAVIGLVVAMLAVAIVNFVVSEIK